MHDARRMPELARRAFREALSGRPGPVHLDIPQDVLAQQCDFADDEFEVAPAAYRGVGRAACERGGCQRSGGSAAAGAAAADRGRRRRGGERRRGGRREACAALRAPVVPTQMALGVVASDSPYFIGHGGIIGGDAVPHAFAEADVILAVGCRFSSWMWDERGPLVRPHHQLININIDPAALGGPALHAVAMQADAGLALADILR